MTALPPVIDSETYGCETTWPSSTMANWFAGVGWAASLPVVSAKALEPASLNDRSTIQPLPLWVSYTACALETSWPFTATPPSANLYQRPCSASYEQATAGSDGSVFW